MLNCWGNATLSCNLRTGSGTVRCEGICGILWLWGKCNWRFKGLLTDSCTSAVVNHPKGCCGILMSVSVVALGCGCRRGDFYLHLSAFQLYFLQGWVLLLISVCSIWYFLSHTRRRDGNVLHSQSSRPGRIREARLPGQTSACSVPLESPLSCCCFLGSDAGREVLNHCDAGRWDGRGQMHRELILNFTAHAIIAFAGLRFTTLSLLLDRTKWLCTFNTEHVSFCFPAAGCR